MEYLEGQTLAKTIAGFGGRLPEQRVIRIALQLCSALSYLHEQNPPIIFRDVKPENVMVDPGAECKTDRLRHRTALSLRRVAGDTQLFGSNRLRRARTIWHKPVGRKNGYLFTRRNRAMHGHGLQPGRQSKPRRGFAHCPLVESKRHRCAGMASSRAPHAASPTSAGKLRARWAPHCVNAKAMLGKVDANSYNGPIMLTN